MNPRKSLSCLMVFALMATVTLAAPQPVTDLDTALTQAKKNKAQLFVVYGRDKCGNCQALRGYIKNGKLKLPADKFVYVELNCDDAKDRQEFGKRFKVEGRTLPFVVIANAEGKQLAARTGYGKDTDFEKLIKDAGSK